MMIADLIEKLADYGFETSIAIGAKLIEINAHKSGVSIDVLGTETVDVYRDNRPYITEFRGPTALSEALNSVA